MSDEKNNSLSESGEFFEFVNAEFEKTAGYATIEELAEFAFGGLGEALAAYEKNTVK
jgi:hypothetical protein